MQNGKTTVTLNDKGILLIGILILSLTFTLGYLASNKGRRETDVIIFTEEDLLKISELQSINDELNSEADIYAYKDENGNLVIGWIYSEDQ